MRGSTSIAEQFRAKFGANPRVYRAPGRVNLIGEHTDYNEGYVMPVALGFYCWLAISPRDDQKLVISSDGFSDTAEEELDSPEIHPRQTWSDYPVGVALELKRAGVPLRGANLLIHGEVPMGAGLSSSAAIEVATALALAEQSGHSPDRVQLALLCQKAENEFVGARNAKRRSSVLQRFCRGFVPCGMLRWVNWSCIAERLQRSSTNARCT